MSRGLPLEMTDIMGRAWLLRGLLLALLVTAGPAELEEGSSEENAFGMFFVPAKTEQPSTTTTPAPTFPVTAWPSPPISATKAPSVIAATTTAASTTTSEAVTKNPLLRMMLEAKLKVLKRREMVAEIGKLEREEEERRSQKKLATALRRMKEKEDLLMEEAGRRFN